MATSKTKKFYTAPVLDQVTEVPEVDAAYAVGNAIYNGVATGGGAVVDSVSWVGSKLLNFGKGLINANAKA